MEPDVGIGIFALPKALYNKFLTGILEGTQQ